MRVASLVIERADLQRRFAEQCARLMQQGRRQEGDPVPDVTSALESLLKLSADIRDLAVRINEANVENGNMGRIAMRDDLDRQLKVLRSALDSARLEGMRNRPTEIRWVANHDITALEARIDVMAKERRLLNEAIQATDWSETP